MKITKLLIASLSVLALSGVAKADDYVVYNNGVLNPELHVYGWWNDVVNFKATNPDGDGEVFEFKPGGQSTQAASMGLNMEKPQNTGVLHSATLNFSWYAKGTGDYTIRLTCPSTEQNYTFKVTADNANKWNTTALNVAETYPNVAKGWDENKNFGEGYVFSVVLENGADDPVIYFNNIYYSNVDNAWEAPNTDIIAPKDVPVPTQAQADVLSIYSPFYTAATSFGIGGWGQSTKAQQTTIDGKNVYWLRNFNYLGWELNPHVDVSAYDYMHVDLWPVDATGFGFTPISPDPTKEKSIAMTEINVQEWNSYDIPLSEWSSAGVNLADLFQIKFDGGSGAECYLTNVYFYKSETGGGGDEPDTPVEPGEPGATWYGTGSGSGDDGSEFVVNYKVVTNDDQTFTVYANFDNLNNVVGLVPQFGAKGMGIVNMSTSTVEGYPYEGTSTNYKFTANENTELFFYLAYAGGAGRIDVTYLYGAENEPPTPLPVITAEAINITENSAEIQYEVVLPDELAGATYSVTMDGTVVSASPIVLSNLSSNTSYTYELVVTATLGGETYESKPVEVKFTTLRAEGDEEPVYTSQISLIIPDCTLIGSSEKTTIQTNISYSITYQDDHTLYIEMEPENQDVFNIIGLVAEVCVNGTYVDMSQTARGNFFSATTPSSYDAQTTVPVFFFLKYADGGPAQSDTINYVTGSTNTETGIANAEIEANENVDIFTLSGVKVRSNVKFNDVRNSLAPGLYIVGGKKVIVK